MENFSEKDIVNGRFFSLWISQEMYGEVKTASAKSELQKESVPIAGQLGNGTVITGAEGSGTLVFHKTYNGLNKKINDSVKAGKAFEFDLIGELKNEAIEGYERVIITGCKITSFSPLDVDITKLLETSYDFTYNPNNVDYE